MNIFTNLTLQTFVPPFQFWVFLVLGFRTFFFVFHHTSLPQKPSPLCSSKKIWMSWLCQGEHSSPWPSFVAYFLWFISPPSFPSFFLLVLIYSPLFFGTIVVRMTFWSLELQNNSTTSMVRFFLKIFCACLLLVPSSKIC